MGLCGFVLDLCFTLVGSFDFGLTFDIWLNFWYLLELGYFYAFSKV